MALLTPTRLDDDDIVGNNRIIYHVDVHYYFHQIKLSRSLSTKLNECK